MQQIRPNQAYKFVEGDIHFITITVVEWVDIFTYKKYSLEIIDALDYCQQEKGLIVHGYVIMSNHLHLMISAKKGYKLGDIMRDFKQFTSRKIVRMLHQEWDSRNRWMLRVFEAAANQHRKVRYFHLWQDGYHGIVCYSHKFTWQKLNYIHRNPVKAMIVSEAHHYLFSSAIDYVGGKGLLPVTLLEW